MNYRILLFILSILAASCVTVEVCDDSYDSDLIAEFKTIQDGEVVDSTVTALTIYGIKDGENDTLYKALPSSGFAVPLDPHSDFSSFVMQVDSLSDTLIIYHGHESYMISYTCGFGNLFTLSRIEQGGGIFKGDTILNELIDAEYEEDEVHIWLYL